MKVMWVSQRLDNFYHMTNFKTAIVDMTLQRGCHLSLNPGMGVIQHDGRDTILDDHSLDLKEGIQNKALKACQ